MYFCMQTNTLNAFIKNYITYYLNALHNKILMFIYGRIFCFLCNLVVVFMSIFGKVKIRIKLNHMIIKYTHVSWEIFDQCPQIMEEKCNKNCSSKNK
jgi:hypothetical protein